MLYHDNIHFDVAYLVILVILYVFIVAKLLLLGDATVLFYRARVKATT